MARERNSFKMGTVEMMTLFILSKGDFYGYQIASLISKLTGGKVTVRKALCIRRFISSWIGS